MEKLWEKSNNVCFLHIYFSLVGQMGKYVIESVSDLNIQLFLSIQQAITTLDFLTLILIAKFEMRQGSLVNKKT